MVIGLAHRHHDGAAGGFALGSKGGEGVGVGGDDGGAVDADGFVDAGDEENQADAGMGDDVLQAVDPAVAGAIGQDERVGVQDMDEAGRIAAGARVHIARTVGRGEDGEGREGDEGLTMGIEVIELLQHGALAGGAEMGAQGGSVGDGVHVV